MLEAVGLNGPGRAAPEDRSDPGFLGTGKHGAIVAEGPSLGPRVRDRRGVQSSHETLRAPLTSPLRIVSLRRWGVWTERWPSTPPRRLRWLSARWTRWQRPLVD